MSHEKPSTDYLYFYDVSPNDCLFFRNTDNYNDNYVIIYNIDTWNNITTLRTICIDDNYHTESFTIPHIWGNYWNPSTHYMLPRPTRNEIKTWLLLAKRLDICKDITKMMVKYIATK